MAVTVTVMRGAQQTEVVGLGVAAERIREDVIDLQQVAGAAAAAAAPVHVAAALIARPDLPLDRGGDGRPAARGFAGVNAAAPAGCAGRFSAVGAGRCGPHSVFGAEVPVAAGRAGRFAGAAASRFSSARSIGGEVPAPADTAARSAIETLAASDSARFFGAEVSAASALRVHVHGRANQVAACLTSSVCRR